MCPSEMVIIGHDGSREYLDVRNLAVNVTDVN